MHALLRDFPTLLKERPTPPCLSLYQPTHRGFPDNRQNLIRFNNLVRSLQQSLAEHVSDAERQMLLEPLRQLSEDNAFWEHPQDGLVVLRAKDAFRVYRIQRSVPELAIVADSFHVKPLVRILQTADYYHVLAIDRQKVRLFVGNRVVLDEEELAPEVPRTLTDALGTEVTQSYLSGSTGQAGGTIFFGHGSRKDENAIDTERFFRAVDRAIWEHHSRHSGLPLVLAALPEHQAVFRRISHNPHLVENGIDANPDALSIDELRVRAWAAVEPEHRRRAQEAIARYTAAAATGMATDELSSVARASVEGRIDTLLVDADRQIAGHIDEEGLITTDNAHAPYDDVLDDLVEKVARRGGKALVLPSMYMPSSTGVAAIYKF